MEGAGCAWRRSTYVAVWLIYADALSLTRNTSCGYWDGEWRHRFGQEDVEGIILPFRCLSQSDESLMSTVAQQ